MLIYSTLALCAGFFLDLILGDPQGWPHIARWIGTLVSQLENKIYPVNPHRSGGRLLVTVVLLSCLPVPLLLYISFFISPWLYFAFETFFCWQLLAAKSLQTESKRVYTAFQANDLQGARKAVSMIVGRDTASLDKSGILRATVETVAENTSDGVIAPLFYLMLGGAPLGFLYKAVNTMDSMIGYKNERYLSFGRFAAKLDDGLNFIPSRLCAALMLLAVRFLKMDIKNALRIFKRDRFQHASPNSAQTESVMAGALRIRLAGDACYFGKLSRKPFIGDDQRPIESEDILRSHRLLYTTAILMLLLAIIIRGIFHAAI